MLLLDRLAEVTLPPLTYPEARSVEAFIVGLKGREGTFTFGSPLHTDTAIVLTSGSTAIRSETLTTSAGSTAVSAGTYFQLGSYLYLVTADKSSGSGTLEFQPPLKETIATGQGLVFNQPKSLWRMASNDVSWSTNQASLQGFSFAMVEAL